MYVIGFLCVSLGSSTVQLHDSLGSRRACSYSMEGFSSQNSYHAWGVYYRRVAFSCGFCGQKDSMQRIFINRCFLFTVGSVCHLKRFMTGSRNPLMDVENRRWCNRGAEVAETAVKWLLCWEFRRAGKAMRQVYQFWWRLCREISVLPCSNITCLRFICICDLFAGSSSYTEIWIFLF
jgi:hypothetical protein